MNICKLFSKVTESKASALFNHIIDYDNIKRLFRMGLDSESKVIYFFQAPLHQPKLCS
jgi:hypothetical protein